MLFVASLSPWKASKKYAKVDQWLKSCERDNGALVHDLDSDTGHLVREARPDPPQHRDVFEALGSTHDKFFSATLNSGFWGEIWTNTLLDEIDNIYIDVLQPHLQGYGDPNDEDWKGAYYRYWEDVIAVCTTHWGARTEYVKNTTNSKADLGALALAREKLDHISRLIEIEAALIGGKSKVARVRLAVSLT